MKNIIKSCILFWSICFVSQGQTIRINQEKQVLKLVLKTINDEYIKPTKIDDEFSKKLFKSYLDSIDIAKIFLLESDIKEFKKFETNLDDQIKNNDLTFFNLTFNRIRERYLEGKEIILTF